jgi:hypothetical protein
MAAARQAVGDDQRGLVNAMATMPRTVENRPQFGLFAAALTFGDQPEYRPFLDRAHYRYLVAAQPAFRSALVDAVTHHHWGFETQPIADFLGISPSPRP